MRTDDGPSISPVNAPPPTATSYGRPSRPSISIICVPPFAVISGAPLKLLHVRAPVKYRPFGVLSEQVSPVGQLVWPVEQLPSGQLAARSPGAGHAATNSTNASGIERG